MASAPEAAGNIPCSSSSATSLAKSDYDTFAVLCEKGVLPTLRQMVSFRNRVVHQYWEVDDATVYRIVHENLDDFDTYVGHILDFSRQ